MSTDEFSYFPKRIKKVRHQGRWRHIDPDTGKVTYPSWHKRATRYEVFTPEDMGMRSVKASEEDKELARKLAEYLVEHHPSGRKVLSEGVSNEDMQNAIMAITGCTSGFAWRHRNRLWCAGLLMRTGVRHYNSNRPMHQIWYLQMSDKPRKETGSE